jgi:signal peptidase I
MEPLFHKGDLAIVRRAAAYKVGDIVLYESPTIHRPVLHRIIVIQNDHYFFKGDHNDFVDPGYATSKDILGKLWFHIPKAGKILSWFGAPLHTALLAGIAVAFLLIRGASFIARASRLRTSSAGLPSRSLSCCSSRASALRCRERSR